MKTLVYDSRGLGAVADHLRKEFGDYLQCRCGCAIFAPPQNVPFEVLEPLETEANEISQNQGRGLDKHRCIPAGIYLGVADDRIHTGTSIHYFAIAGSPEHKTERVHIDLYSGCVDWRGVRAIKQA